MNTLFEQTDLAPTLEALVGLKYAPDSVQSRFWIEVCWRFWSCWSLWQVEVQTELSCREVWPSDQHMNSDCYFWMDLCGWFTILFTILAGSWLLFCLTFDLLLFRFVNRPRGHFNVQRFSCFSKVIHWIRNASVSQWVYNAWNNFCNKVCNIK